MWEMLVRLARWLGFIDWAPNFSPISSPSTGNTTPLLGDGNVGGPHGGKELDLERGKTPTAADDADTDGMHTPREVVQADAGAAVADDADTDGMHTPREKQAADTDLPLQSKGAPTANSPVLAPLTLTSGNLSELQNGLRAAEQGRPPLVNDAATAAAGLAIRDNTVKPDAGSADGTSSQISAGAASGVSVSKTTLTLDQAQTFQLVNNNGIQAITIISRQCTASRDWTDALAHVARQDLRKGKNVLGGAATDFAPSKSNLLQAINTLGNLDVKVYAEWWLRATAQASYFGAKHTDGSFPFLGALDESPVKASKTKTQFNAAKSAWEREYIAKVTLESQLGLVATQVDELVTPVKIGLPGQSKAIAALKAKLDEEKQALNIKAQARTESSLTTPLWRTGSNKLQASLKHAIAGLKLLGTFEAYLLPVGAEAAKGFTYEDWLTLKGLSTNVQGSEFFGALKHPEVNAFFQAVYDQWQKDAISTIQVEIGLAAPAATMSLAAKA